MVQIIKNTEYTVMPWKNGQGVTSQIDIYPPNAAFPGNEFLWRVSSATVQASSAFSQFNGYDRYLTILKGDGLMLNETKLGPYEIIHFKGEETIFAKLIDKTVVDLGVIYRRDFVQCSMSIETIPGGKSAKLKLSGDTNYLFCAEGIFKLGKQEAKAGDCVKTANVEEIEITTGNHKELKFFLIQISLLV